jgi:hypothetical protein
MRTLSQLQRRYDASEPADDVECDLGMVPCDRCGRTGVDPRARYYPGEDDACERCSGDGVVSCPGCSECGRGERPEVCDG